MKSRRELNERRTVQRAIKIALAIAIVLALFLAFRPTGATTSADSDIVSLSFSANGGALLAGTQAGELFLLDVRDGSVLASWQSRRSWLDRRTAPFNSIALSPQGDFAVFAGINTIDVVTFNRAKPIPKPDAPAGAFGGTAISPDGQRLAAISSAEKLFVWNLNSPGAPIDFGKADAGVYGSTAFSPDGKRIAVLGHTLRVLDAERGAEIWSSHRDNYAGLCVAFRPDGKILATAGQDTSIRLWNAGTGNQLATLRAHRNYVDGVSFSPDGAKLLSWSRDGEAYVWDLATTPAQIQAKLSTKGGAAFTPDGRAIATGKAAKSIMFWDVQSGKKLREVSIASQTR